MAAIPSSHRDLLDSQVATLATIGPDGRPQLSEVWFLADGDRVSLSLNTSRQKTKNLQANPAATLLILDLANPYRYLEIRGDAEITADDDYNFADRLGAKYQADLRDRDQPGDSRVVVTIRPVRVRAWPTT
ncbi:MAG TPA: PPOX class F420-dependent oxidoreductase [Streptosporangiaceae bacterium]|jgi:PPOX class probable F420-dependent enzyme|nr:PPOX class F420-dependent oxidoreductase [Streptosporangiaceae bacterium]